MAINYDKLLALKIPDVEHAYTDKDTMLYALGVGLGHDPLDAKQLDFVYEKNLKALPTFAAVLGYPGFWVRDLDTGIDWVKIVNGEQGVSLYQPLKPAGTVLGKSRIVEVIDKGAGKGALVYRLSADLNPLHADLDVAKAAGFPRPILHGLGTFGVVGHALLKSVCNYDPARFTAMSGRFSAPVFPGETIRTEIWRDGNVVSFRALVPERNIVAMSNGRAEITA